MIRDRILIVEDELIVAKDLRSTLEKMGYEVVGSASSGAAAIQLAEARRPDLVLMDIHLQGPMDGIEAAERIHSRLQIPVSYLTAYSDKPTLERAKATLPYGYVLKPFDEQHLFATIEIAIYRHKTDRMLNQLKNWHAAAMQTLNEAVLILDNLGCIVFMNKSAEALTGLTMDFVLGKRVGQVFKIQEEPDSPPLLWIERKEHRLCLAAVKTPLRNERDRVTGTVCLLKEMAPAPAGD